MAKATPTTYTLNEVLALLTGTTLTTPNGRQIHALKVETYQAKNGQTLIRFEGATPDQCAQFRVCDVVSIETPADQLDPAGSDEPGKSDRAESLTK